MALTLREVSLHLDQDEAELPRIIEARLGLASGVIRDWTVLRRAVDARRKPRVLRVYSVAFEVVDEAELLTRHAGDRRLGRWDSPPPVQLPLAGNPHRSLVVGMGPAGLFAALFLATAGVRVTLVERGQPVEQRVRDVEQFWGNGTLLPESNVQFGEGGAGAFSDGKLTTRVRNPWSTWVLQTLVECGAPPTILADAKPHVGTDRLRLVLIRLRRRLQALGVELRFGLRLDGLETDRGRIVAGELANGERIACDSLVLAPGHSARDTYARLAELGVQLEAKPFAIGLRVEHPARLINRIQYGWEAHPQLGAADYALSWNDAASGRGVYSFCMCPGGEVIVAASEDGGVVVNGMSRLRRDGAWSNSALVVTVRPEDFGGAGPLAGVAFQRRWEQAAYRAGGGAFRAPAQALTAYLGRGGSLGPGSCRPGMTEADLQPVLPDFVHAGLRQALPSFDRAMKGFISPEATLVGIESRTSAPLRILRGGDGQSLSHPGLYPAGEGAGYAGGIISAALDGIRAAEAIVQTTHHRSCR